MRVALQSWGRLLKTWRIETCGQEALSASRALVRNLSSEPPESAEKESEDKPGQESEGGSQSEAPAALGAAATSEQDDASLPPQSTGSAPETSAAPTAEDFKIKRTNYVRYNASAPAATTVEQHYADTTALDHSILKDEFLDGPDELSHDHGTPIEPGPPRLTALESELINAVNDQYGEFGVTVEDLRTYLDVSLDIEDAITVGRKANIEPERYKVYKQVDQLIKFGPEKSPEEQQRLDELAEDEMLTYPWPSTMVRQYLKEKHGAKLRRMKKDTQTQYDQGWMTDTILPFESEDEMKCAFSKEADPKVISSYWEDELNDEGQVNRFPQRSVGTEDLSDWAQAVAAAMITPADDPSRDAVREEHDGEGPWRPNYEKVKAAIEKNMAADGMTGEDGASAASLDSPEDQASEEANSELETSQDGGEESEYDEDEYGQLGPTIVFEGGEHEHRQPDALGALMEAKFGNDKMYGLPPEERERLNKMAAAAITDAAFKEQENSILRTHGYDPEQRDTFLSELGMGEEDWKEWVKTEVMQTLERLGSVQMDHRSPQDMIEEFVASQSLVAPWAGPANDMREVVENHPRGPTSDYHIMPEEGEDDRHPAAEKALWDSVIDGASCEYAAPEIFKFDQRIFMHLHDQPYHPANRRITLRVRLEDLKMKYGLTDEAIIHIVTIAGKRYNPNNGVISITCDRHRAREENRRQALHWALKLVESALLQHPSEEWEFIKEMQSKALEQIDKPSLCPFESFIQDDDEQPFISAQEPIASMANPS